MKKDKYILNSRMLLSVKISDRKICYYLEWKSEIKPKLFGLISGRREGFYSEFMGESSYYSMEEIQSGKFNDIILIVENKVAYYKPNVKLTFIDKYEINTEFNTYEEAINWGQEQINKSIDVKIQIEINN